MPNGAAQDAAERTAVEAGLQSRSSAEPRTPTDPANPIEQGASASAESYTDAQIDAFAEATVNIRAIDENTALDEQTKQQQMVEAVTGAGLQPDTYNSMGQVISSDQALRAKVQEAMAKHTPGEG